MTVTEMAHSATACNRPDIRCAWRGPSLLVTGTDGRCGEQELSGFFFRETRYLRAGYIEYLTRAPEGPRHQGWKDSNNAVVGRDGSQVAPPLAPCEIQGYYFSALRFMAVLSVVMGEQVRALKLWTKARAFKKRFNRDFWMAGEDTFALGLDADKRPIRSVTSNAGQCLTTGIVAMGKIPRLVRRLFQPDLFSGWGLRRCSRYEIAWPGIQGHLI